MPERGSSIKITLPSGSFTFDKSLLRKTLRQAGNEVAKIDRTLLKTTQGQGRLYGSHRASAPGQPGAKITGDLSNSVKVVVAKGGDSVAVKETMYYAKFLEVGAKGGGKKKGGGYGRNKRSRNGNIAATNRTMEPRPSLQLAMQQAKDIPKRIEAALKNSIDFKTGKPHK